MAEYVIKRLNTNVRPPMYDYYAGHDPKTARPLWSVPSSGAKGFDTKEEAEEMLEQLQDRTPAGFRPAYDLEIHTRD